MHDGTLDDALKAQCGLGIYIIQAGHLWRIVFNEVGQGFAKVVHIGRTRPQNFGRARVIKQSQEQMLNRNKFVALLTRLDKSHMQTYF